MLWGRRDGESSNRLRMEDSRSSGPSWRRTRDREPDIESEHAGGVSEGEQEVEPIHTEPNPIDNVAVDYHAVDTDQVSETVKADSEKPPELHVKEGRQCVLREEGGNGRPPRKVAEGSMDSEKEEYEGASALLVPNYNTSYGFGVEPEWLGRLLRPWLDRYGIAHGLVHRLCAVWSPEVYFAFVLQPS